MFTGIVRELGKVAQVEASADGARLTIHAPETAPGVQVGDSVAINGVCLTVVRKEGERLWFEAVQETLRRSNLGALKPGDRVNLETALRVGDAMGGHFVQGHVDTTGVVQKLVPQGNAVVMVIGVDREWMRYLVPKGSVAVDGVSLTVNRVADDDSGCELEINLIPHTLQGTTLGTLAPGMRVNLEVDLIARYVERMLGSAAGVLGAAILLTSWEFAYLARRRPPIQALVLAEDGRWAVLPILDTTAAPMVGRFSAELSPAAADMLMPHRWGRTADGVAYGEVHILVYLPMEVANEPCATNPDTQRSRDDRGPCQPCDPTPL